MSRNQSKQNSRAPSGTSTPAVVEAAVPAGPVCASINFGQSFSSVAIINKEGVADCIANDDGERQVASAISFNGTETYTGVPARVQLVRNAENTILGFRNLLGKTYDEVKNVKQPYNSAPIVDANGMPGFTVLVDGVSTTFTAHQIAVRFLAVLLSYATDFVGRRVTGAVLSIPSDFTPIQIVALKKAAKEAGIRVLQTITETAAALTAYHSTLIAELATTTNLDRNAVVLDVGGTSTNVSVVAIRDGLFVPLSNVFDATLGGDLFDAKLMEWFGKEFTKKTRVPLEASNHRALMKLRLAVEVTKKSLSASSTAPCSVESLAEGMDFHGSINRMRFDLLAGTIYARIVKNVQSALEKAGVDSLNIAEIVLVGGTSRLPTLSERLASLFPESTRIVSQIDPDEVIAKGCALQSLTLLTTYAAETPIASLALIAATLSSVAVTEPKALSKPIGLVIAGEFVTLVGENTPWPLRRIVDVQVPNGSGASSVILSLAEGTPSIKIDLPVKKSKGFFSRASKDDEEDEDEEPEEIRTAIVTPAPVGLAELTVEVILGKESEKVRITVVVDAEGRGSVSAKQLREDAVEATGTF